MKIETKLASVQDEHSKMVKDIRYLQEENRSLAEKVTFVTPEQQPSTSC